MSRNLSRIPESTVPANSHRAAPKSFWTESMFREFFEQAPFYAGILSPDGRVNQVGRMALEAGGYSTNDVVGRMFWETPWWRGSAQVQAQIKTAFEAATRGERFQAVLPYLFADGTERWVDFALGSVFDDEGSLSFVIATGTDITNRIQAESELAVVRRRMDSALIAADIATYEWNVLSDRLHGDRNLARFFGLTLDATGEAPLGDFMSLIHPEDQARVSAGIQHSVATGENFEADYRIVHPAGERWVNSRGRMVRDAEGRVVNFFWIINGYHRAKTR